MSDREKNKTKIVFVLTTCDIGGTERQFIELVGRLDRTRFDLRVLAFSENGKLRAEIDALRIPFTSLEYSGIKGKFHLGSYLRLYKLIRKMVRYFHQEKPDIVQSYLFWGNVYGGIAAKIAGVPCIITQRRGFLEERYLKKWYCRWLLGLSNRWTTKIIANSNIVKQHCLQEEKCVTDKKVQVIYNGIELKQYVVNIDLTEKKKTFGIPDNVRIVGIIANLIPYKGHQDFLNAAARVLHVFPHTTFLLIGRDHHGSRSDLEQIAEQLHIRQSVIFTGVRDDIPELLAILDVQVSPSLTESLSNAILEGMAAAKPVVATHVGGNVELIIHEETGLLVPPGNPDSLAAAIMRLLGDEELRLHLGRAGRKRVAEMFQMERMLEQTEAFYENA